MTLRIGCLFISLFVWLSPASAAETAEREFSTGYAGSRPQDQKLLTGTYFDDPQVRALIYKLEEKPFTRAEVEAALAETGVSIAALLRVKILREDSGLYFIGFNYFTRDDMKAVHAAAESYVPKMVDEYMNRKGEFDAIFAQYRPEGVSL